MKRESTVNHYRKLEALGLDMETRIMKIYMREYAELNREERTGEKKECIPCKNKAIRKAKKKERTNEQN